MPEDLPLRDIIAFEPHWWPPAPVWWFLIVVAVFILYVVLYWLVGYFRGQYAGLKKAALIELIQIQAQEHIGDQQLAKEISSLLKRVAMSRFPEQNTECLNGEKWLKFLNESVSEAHFTSADSMVIDVVHYQRRGSFDQLELIKAARRWLNAL